MAESRCAGPGALGLLDQQGKPFQTLRPDQHVDQLAVGFLKQLLAFLLSDASGNGDYRPRTGFFAEYADFAETGVQLLFRPLTHATGIDHDDVGVAVVVRTVVACLLEQTGHPLRVVIVHLATERFDEVLHSVSVLIRVYQRLTFAFAFYSLSPRSSRALRRVPQG